MYRFIFNKKTWFDLLETLVLVFVTLTLVFILMHVIPGQTAKLANSSLPIEQQRALVAQYGLDKPLLSQYLLYLNGIFTKLDFGISLAVRVNDHVSNIIDPKIQLSLIMALIALVFAFFLGYIFGAFFGINFKNVFGTLGHIQIAIFISLPSYILGILVVVIASAANRADLVLFDYHNAATWVLPILVLSIPYITSFANLVSGVIKNESQMQYVKFARAKGLSAWKILTRHLFKRGIFSSLVILPTNFVGLIIGGLFIDNIFAIPGIGSVLGQAILSKDYDIVQTLIILFAFLNSFSFWVRDVLLLMTDPRLASAFK